MGEMEGELTMHCFNDPTEWKATKEQGCLPVVAEADSYQRIGSPIPIRLRGVTRLHPRKVLGRYRQVLDRTLKRRTSPDNTHHLEYSTS